jgi:long-subunit fatty acid transport protein
MAGIDVGYTHLWFQKAAINMTSFSGTQQAYLLGKAKSSADLIGVQLTLNFV